MPESVIIVIVVTLILAGLAIFLAPDNPYDKKEMIINNTDDKKDEILNNIDDIQKYKLGVSDGIRFGFGFGIGMLIWVVLLSLILAGFAGIIMKEIMGNMF